MNRKVYFYKQKLPLSFFSLIFFGLIVFAVLAVLGLFVVLILGATVIGLIIVRLLFSPEKKKVERAEKDGRTVTLKEGEYEVIREE